MGLTLSTGRPPGAGPRGGGGVASRLHLRLHPAGVVVLVALVVLARVPALAPGSGPGFGLVTGLAAALVVDGAWSLVALRRRGLQIAASAPTDAVVGDPMAIRVHVEGRGGRFQLRLSSLRSAPLLAVDAPAAGEVPTVPERRGRFAAIELSLLHSAPFGLVGAVRSLSVPLNAPVFVGPRPLPVGELPLPPLRAAAEACPAPARDGDELLRGARPYVPGDSLRAVHWPSTARVGQLMVREMDSWHQPAVLVVADLGRQPGSAAERAAGRAAGVALSALANRRTVLLATCEGGTWHAAPAAGERDIARRLAVAEPGPEPPLDALVSAASDVPAVVVAAEGPLGVQAGPRPLPPAGLPPRLGARP